MVSKIAKRWLRSLGVDDSAHTGIERGNFAAGRGVGCTTLFWHLVRFDATTGDSKVTVGYATDDDVREQLDNLRSSNEGRYGYYARNVKTGRIIR